MSETSDRDPELAKIREERLATMELLGHSMVTIKEKHNCSSCYFRCSGSDICGIRNFRGPCRPKANLRDVEEFWTPDDEFLEGDE